MSHEIVKFCKKNDIANKIRVAIERVDNGDGWGPFEGLQHGEAMVRVSYNGENIVFTQGPLLVGFDVIPKVITNLPEKTIKKINDVIVPTVLESPVTEHISESEAKSLAEESKPPTPEKPKKRRFTP